MPHIPSSSAAPGAAPPPAAAKSTFPKALGIKAIDPRTHAYDDNKVFQLLFKKDKTHDSTGGQLLPRAARR